MFSFLQRAVFFFFFFLFESPGPSPLGVARFRRLLLLEAETPCAVVLLPSTVQLSFSPNRDLGETSGPPFPPFSFSRHRWHPFLPIR